MKDIEITPIVLEFYRYRDVYDMDGTNIVLEKFISIKATRRGHWIVPKHVYHSAIRQEECEYGEYYDDTFNKDEYYKRHKRWVNSYSQKRLAYPNKVEAMNNFMARKKVQLRLLTQKLASVEVAIKKGEKLKRKLFEEVFEPGHFTVDHRTKQAACE